MKNSVIYASKTGHSRKIANAVASELKVDAYDVKKTPILENVDILYIVGGIYAGKSAPEMIDYLKTLSEKNVKRAVLLTSSASKKGRQNDVRKILTDNGIAVSEEEFKCRGGFLIIAIGHPNSEDIKNAVEFVKKTSQ